jgi:hypothetical protein
MALRNHPYYQQAKEVNFSYIANTANANYGYVGDHNANSNWGKVQVFRNQGCHYSFNAGHQSMDLNSILINGFVHPEDNLHIVEEYISWIMGDKSPWKKITQFKDDIEIVQAKNKKNYSHILIGPEVHRAISPLFIKNFFISNRFISERCLNAITWYKLIKEYDLDPRDAYFLCKFMVLIDSDSEKKWSSPSLGYHDGGHWPITWHSSYIDSIKNFSWYRFWTGEINSEFPRSAYKVNGFWFDSKTAVKKYPEFKLHQKKFNTISPIQVFCIEEVVETWLKFKKENGLIYE